MTGGKTRKLLSHTTAYVQKPAPVATSLPRSLYFKESFQVVFAGRPTPIEIALAKKRFQIRLSKVYGYFFFFDSRLLDFYIRCNRLYKDMQIEADINGDLEILLDEDFDESIEDPIISNHRIPIDINTTTSADDIIETHSFLSQAAETNIYQYSNSRYILLLC